MFHIIYKTTCVVTGKYYVGMHSTDTLEDGYLGSGTLLQRSIKKHGKDKHVRVILEHCEDRDTLAKREERLVSPDLLSDPQCMNLNVGGVGKYPGLEVSLTTREKLSLAQTGKTSPFKGKTHSDEVRQKVSIARSGKPRSEETKKKLSAKMTGRTLSEQHRKNLSASSKWNKVTRA